MNRAQIIIFGSTGAIVIFALLLVTGVIPGLQKKTPPAFTLVVWGTDPAQGIWDVIAQTYREQGIPSATIEYQKKSPATYEGELLNALATGDGPDIFFLPDDWIEKHLDKVKILPEGSLDYQKRNLKSIFADRLADAIVTSKGELIGTPLAFNTLGLFFNRDAFNAATIPNPPLTWDEFVTDAEKLTKLSEVGGIQSSGAAIGAASNVDHASDIFSALLSQNGVAVISPDTKRSGLVDPKVNQILAFYTSFANITKKTYSWNPVFEPSLDAFAKGDTAMAFGYTSDIERIVAVNPQLNFDSAKFPQLAGTLRQVNFGRFTLLAVSRTSEQSDQAWQFLLWLQGKDIQKTYIDALGLSPARRDLVLSTPPKDYLAPFYDEVLSAEVFPPLFAHSLQPIISDMIDTVVNHRFTIDQAIKRASSQLDVILSKPRL